MADYVFNKGIDFWFAHYFENLGFCFRDEQEVVKFGEYFCGKLNQSENKISLCRDIIGEISKNIEFFGDVDTRSLDSSCFLEENISFNKDFFYIRFPDFKNEQLKGLLLRLDINPCVGEKISTTKIYCILRYIEKIDIGKAVNFFATAEIISEGIINILTEVYFDQVKHYCAENNYPEDDILKIENLKRPKKIISRIVGSDDNDLRTFIELTKNPDSWMEYCKTNKGKTYLEILRKINSKHKKNWKLSDYDWYTQNVLLEEKSRISESREAKAYFGFKEDEEMAQLIGIADSFPRDILLPIHLQLIQTR